MEEEADLHMREDCDQEVPVDPVICFFLVAEGEDSTDVVFRHSSQ